MTQYPVPKPEFFNRLKNNPLLALPNQQATLDQYATGEIGIGTTVARFLADAKVRGPILQAERDATTKERARRVRVQREMALNETATGPTFVDCDAEGNPLNGSASSDGDEADESGSSGTDHSNGDQELDQDLDGDLNQEAEELDEFGEPLRAAEAEQSEWDDVV